MNIRKFIGATSRDALRLVREALGADAVVLSNRTMDDGSVEIVALADSDLASIAPKAGAASGMPALPAARSSSFAQSNPYASGMPDVFSAVFGASPEVGADVAQGAAVLDAAKPAASPESTDAADADRDWQAPASFEPRAGSRGEQNQEARADDIAPRLDTHAGPAPKAPKAPARAAAAEPLVTRAPEMPRTMAESNPWLIDHARRIAAQKTQGNAAQASKPHAMTPAAAAAKGLGAPGKVLTTEELAAAAQPDWAREATQSAARRAAARLGLPRSAVVTPAGEIDGATSSMAETIRARVEQMVNETVMNELSSMRGMMEEHFAGLLWGDRQRRSPTHGALTKHLFAAGFSAQLVQMVVDKMPEVADMDAGMDWVNTVLANNLPVLENEDALMERGGVFALMGPTGVGKTTTTAKLAARCVMRFGASKVALLTTDSYRIGGHEQLRIFGKILGVSVHAVKDAADLQLALAELRNKHIVLIDTIGMSQRDRMVSDHIAMLCGAGQPVHRLLLLNATSHGDTLNEVVQAYQSAPGQPELAGCILTKLDEATNLGSVLDTVIRYKLPVHYVSTGQKVPENLYVATKKFLIKSAFCIPRDGSPFVPEDDDVPALLSALSARSTAELHEVRFG
ncbi:flagellar biosynthesis protein FlhF [Trinickia terrae]|uniref:Flagellar biosynthesis protein FlhF n=1 Tax=Trinickia terrae TaxID=2571161 RepID=A0A4U1I769_9BURK|nr:flagellar biosynthesis protein FlhF [Trinickia terrae]TKC89251.1 flagellar biosynthesis protein FlhF [Trinickia terrae]